MSKFISIKNVHVNETDIYFKRIMCINCFFFFTNIVKSQNNYYVTSKMCPEIYVLSK